MTNVINIFSLLNCTEKYLVSKEFIITLKFIFMTFYRVANVLKEKRLLQVFHTRTISEYSELEFW